MTAEKGSPLYAAQKAADDRMRAEGEAPAGEWEYRNVGRHDWGDGYLFCRNTGCRETVPCRSSSRPRLGCPSKRERRRVGPWEPVPKDET